MADIAAGVELCGHGCVQNEDVVFQLKLNLIVIFLCCPSSFLTKAYVTRKLLYMRWWCSLVDRVGPVFHLGSILSLVCGQSSLIVICHSSLIVVSCPRNASLMAWRALQLIGLYHLILHLLLDLLDHLKAGSRGDCHRQCCRPLELFDQVSTTHDLILIITDNAKTVDAMKFTST